MQLVLESIHLYLAFLVSTAQAVLWICLFFFTYVLVSSGGPVWGFFSFSAIVLLVVKVIVPLIDFFKLKFPRVCAYFDFYGENHAV